MMDVAFGVAKKKAAMHMYNNHVLYFVYDIGGILMLSEE